MLCLKLVYDWVSYYTWNYLCLGSPSSLIKSRTTPKAGPMVVWLGWPESAGVRSRLCHHWEQLVKVLEWHPLPPPRTPKADIEHCSFSATQRLSECICLQKVLNLTGSGALDSSLGLDSLVPFFPTESWENRKWLVVYLYLVSFCVKVHFFTRLYPWKQKGARVKADTLGLLTPSFIWLRWTIVRVFTKGLLGDVNEITFVGP